MWSVQKNKVLEIEGKKVKRQVVDGESVYMLYNRLRKKYSLLFTVTKTGLDITLYERESRQLFREN